MEDVRLHGAGGRGDLLERAQAREGGGADDAVSQLSQLLQHHRGGRLAEEYSARADDSALSEPRREALAILAAAQGLSESGAVEECLRMAERALGKFRALDTGGEEGVADALHVMIDAHRLAAFRQYKEPTAALEMAQEHLSKLRDAGDRRGEAVMKLALAEIRSDDCRPGKRRLALEPAMEALAIARELQDRRLEAKCLLEAAFVHFSLRDPDSMLECAEGAIAISTDLGDEVCQGLAQYAAGLSYARRSDWEPAHEWASAALETFRSAERRFYEAGVLHSMALWRLLEGRPKRAVAPAEQALQLLRGGAQSGTAPAEAVVTMTLCQALSEAKSPKGALKVAKESLERFESAGWRREQALAHEALAIGHLASESPEKAARVLEAARGLAEDLGERRYESRLLLTAAAMQVQLKDRDEACALLERSAHLAEEEGDLVQLARAQRELAAAQLAAAAGPEGLESASWTAGEAAKTARRAEDQFSEAKATLQMALCHALQEEHSKAATACADAEELFREVGSAEGEALALGLFAEVHAMDGKLDAALDAARERLAIAQRLSEPRLVVAAAMLMASLLGRAERFDEGERQCEEAIATCQRAEESKLELEAQLLLVQLLMERAQRARDTSVKALVARAAKVAAEAVLTAMRLGEKAPRAVALYWRAQVLLVEGKFQEAQRAAGEAEALFRHAQSPRGQAACMHLSGALHAVFGQADRALDCLEKALAVAQSAVDSNLEYEISTSIYNVQQQLAPQQQHMLAGYGQQHMMPEAGAGAWDEGGGDAGAAAYSAAIAAAQPKGLEPAFVRKQLMAFVKDVIATEDELELDSPFMEAGLDSLSSVSLMSMVAKEFQMALSPSLVFDFPTVRALEDHLVEESKMG